MSEPLFDCKQNESYYVCQYHKKLGRNYCDCYNGVPNYRILPTMYFSNRNTFRTRSRVKGKIPVNLNKQRNVELFDGFYEAESQLLDTRYEKETLTFYNTNSGDSKRPNKLGNGNKDIINAHNNNKTALSVNNSNFPPLQMRQQDSDSDVANNFLFGNLNAGDAQCTIGVNADAPAQGTEQLNQNEQSKKEVNWENIAKELKAVVEQQQQQIQVLISQQQTQTNQAGSVLQTVESDEQVDWADVLLGQNTEAMSPELGERKVYSKEIPLVKFDINKGTKTSEFFDIFQRLASQRHDVESFPSLLKKHLTGRALMVYEDNLGESLPYKILRYRMEMVLKHEEDEDALPTISDDVKYEEGYPFFAFLTRISTQLMWCSDKIKAQDMALNTFFTRIPEEACKEIQDKAAEKTRKSGKIKTDFNTIAEAIKEYDELKKQKSKMKMTFAGAVKSNAMQINTLESSRQPRQFKKRDATQEGNPRRRHRSQSRKRQPYCWNCAKNHWTQHCPEVKYKNPPTCKFCHKKHDFVNNPCKEKLDKMQEWKNQRSSKQGKSESKVHNSDSTDKNRSETTSKFNTNSKDEKETDREKTAVGFKWSTYNLDEMKTSKQVDKKDTIEVSKVDKKGNKFSLNEKNKATYFLRDLIWKNGKKGRGSVQQYYDNFFALTEKMNKAKKKFYSCPLKKCLVKRHSHSFGNKGEFDVVELCDRIKQDFPNCVLATYQTQEEINKISTKTAEPKQQREWKRRNAVPTIKFTKSTVQEKNKVSTEKKSGNHNDVHYSVTEVHPNVMLVKMSLGSVHDLVALVDSGAQCSLLTSKVASECSKDWQKSSLMVSGIGRDAEYYSTFVDKIQNVKLEGMPMKAMEFYTIQKFELPYDVILGRGFFELNKLNINFADRVITHEKSQQSPLLTLEVNHKEGQPYSKPNEVINSLTVNNVECILDEDTHLVPGKVSDVRIRCEADWLCSIVNEHNLLCCLELDDSFPMKNPKIGLVDPKCVQEICIIPDFEVKYEKGDKIGNIFTVKYSESLDNLNGHFNYISTIMTDEELVDGINNSPEENHSSQNPNAVFDKIEKFPESMPMNKTPQEFLLGDHARIFKPRDMVLFEESHLAWKRAGCPADGLPDEWTREKIKETFKIPDNLLSNSQLEKFYDIIEKYRVAFVRNSGDLAVGTVGQIDLVLKPGDHSDLRVKPSKWNPDTNKIIQDICNDYLMAGIIKRSSGPYSSRVHVVYKRTTDSQAKSKPRMVVDFRKVNQSLVQCSKYLRGVDSLLMQLGAHQFYSKLDLKGAYHQLAILENKKEITSIVTNDAQYAFNVLPFGICVAVGYFELFMQHIFEKIPIKELIHYLDDCLVPSDKIDDMLCRLERFLYLVVRHRMKLEPHKSEFFRSEIDFLGFRLTSRGIQKSKEYTDRIKDYKEPVTIHELMKFLGVVNFQRRFIPDCSRKLKPLIDAIDRNVKNVKKAKVMWTNEMMQSFKSIKEEIANDIALAFPDLSSEAAPLMLFVDASNVATGSSLQQYQKGELRIISHMSKMLQGPELRYNTYDKELLALIRGIEAHRQYLVGKKFQVYTDCKNVVYLFKMKHACPRLMRAMERLSEYDYEVVHVSGKDNVISDWLSRLDGYVPSRYHERLLDGLGDEYVPPNMDELEVRGGAHALYETIVHAQGVQHGIVTEVNQVRRELIDEIINHPVKYNLRGSDQKLREYRAMRKPGVAPTLLVLQAAANLYKIVFKVYYGLEQPLVFAPRLRKGAATVPHFPIAYIRCEGQGAHYNILIPKKGFVEDNVDRTEYPLHENQENINSVDSEIDREDEIFQMTMLLDQWDLGEAISQDEVFSLSELRRKASYLATTTTLSVPPRKPRKMCSDAHSYHDLMLNIEENNDTRSICILLDTGATSSAISYKALEELKAIGRVITENWKQKIGQVKPFGTKCIEPLGMAEIRIPFKDIEDVIVRVLVLDKEDMNVCLILGGDFLEKNKIELECVPEKQANQLIYFNQEKENGLRLTLKGSFEERSGIEVVHNANCIIPINSLTLKKETSENYESSDYRNGSDYVEAEEIIAHQKAIPELRQLFSAVKNKNASPPDDYKLFIKDIRVNRDGLLTFKGSPLISQSFLAEHLAEVHEYYGHIGSWKLWKQVEGSLWHPKIRKMVADISRSCPICQVNKPYTTQLAPPVHKKIVTKPYELVCMDVLTLPKSKKGNTAALIVADHGSKFLQVYPIRNHKTETIIECLEKYIASSVRCPSAFLSDGAPEFRSEKFQVFCKERGIEHLFGSPHNPNTNGFSERNCGIVVSQLKMMTSDVADWDQYMYRLVVTHNNTVSMATGQTPSSFILKRSHTFHAKNVLPPLLKEKWRKGNPNFAPIKVGEEVLLKLHHVGNLAINKFKSRFEGIFKVQKIYSEGLIYDVQSILNEKDVRKNIHFNDIRVYYKPSNDLWMSEPYRKIYERWYQTAMNIEQNEKGNKQRKVSFLPQYSFAVPQPQNKNPTVNVKSDAPHGNKVENLKVSKLPLASLSVNVDLGGKENEVEEGIFQYDVQLSQQEVSQYEIFLGIYQKLQNKMKDEIPQIPKVIFVEKIDEVLRGLANRIRSDEVNDVQEEHEIDLRICKASYLQNTSELPEEDLKQENIDYYYSVKNRNLQMAIAVELTVIWRKVLLDIAHNFSPCCSINESSDLSPKRPIKQKVSKQVKFVSPQISEINTKIKEIENKMGINDREQNTRIEISNLDSDMNSKIKLLDISEPPKNDIDVTGLGVSLLDTNIPNLNDSNLIQPNVVNPTSTLKNLNNNFKNCNCLKTNKKCLCIKERVDANKDRLKEANAQSETSTIPSLSSSTNPISVDLNRKTNTSSWLIQFSDNYDKRIDNLQNNRSITEINSNNEPHSVVEGGPLPSEGENLADSWSEIFNKFNQLKSVQTNSSLEKEAECRELDKLDLSRENAFRSGVMQTQIDTYALYRILPEDWSMNFDDSNYSDELDNIEERALGSSSSYITVGEEILLKTPRLPIDNRRTSTPIANDNEINEVVDSKKTTETYSSEKSYKYASKDVIFFNYEKNEKLVKGNNDDSENENQFSERSKDQKSSVLSPILDDDNSSQSRSTLEIVLEEFKRKHKEFLDWFRKALD